MTQRLGENTSYRTAAVVLLALAGCGKGPETEGAPTGIALRSAIDSTCVEEGQTLTFDIEVYEDANADDIPDDPANPTIFYPGLDLTQVFDVTDLDLGTDGTGTGLTGVWVGGDQFFQIWAGIT